MEVWSPRKTKSVKNRFFSSYKKYVKPSYYMYTINGLKVVHTDFANSFLFQRQYSVGMEKWFRSLESCKTYLESFKNLSKGYQNFL